MKSVKVEAWDNIEGWKFGGFYDLDTDEGEKDAKKKVSEMRSKFSLVRCKPIST